MPRRFRATPTAVHPSLLPAPRPTLVDTEIPPSPPARRPLPGGAFVEERRPRQGSAELVLTGEVDTFDRGALIDICTALVLEGARDIRVVGDGIEFVDLRILDAFATITDHCRRLGGSFELVGLREPFASLWTQVNPAVQGPERAATADGRVVPLRRPVAGARFEAGLVAPVIAPAAPERSRPGADGPILRVVADVPTPSGDAAAPSARPA